jgi:AsmA protein
VALKVKAKGDAGSVALTDGLFELDESKLAFSARAREFSRPDLVFDLHLDRIDLDRYLPPAAEKGSEAEAATEKPTAQEKAKSPDYEPLRRLILEGTLKIDEMTAKGLHIQDLLMKIAAKDGLIQLDPMDVKLYQGSVSSNVKVDVQGKEPKSRLSVQMNGIQAGPLVRDMAGKDIIEGVVQGDISVNTVGDQPDPIKRSLNGKGELVFKDGAIVGIDLANMVRNVQSAFGMAEKPTAGERPKTDFTELRSPFTIRNGLVNTAGTEMKSPLLRVVASGTANLVDESLNMRVEPKVVATIKGQGDTEDRSGLRVPVLVTGTFSDPKFRPDLKGMFEEGLKQGIPDASGLKKMIEPGDQESGQSTEEAVKEKVKGLLKGFGLGD